MRGLEVLRIGAVLLSVPGSAVTQASGEQSTVQVVFPAPVVATVSGRMPATNLVPVAGSLYFGEMIPGDSEGDVRPLLITAEFLAGLAGEYILGNAGLMLNNPTGMVGYTLGSTVGIQYAGNAGGETGPLWRTLLGSMAGVTIGWYLGDITRGIVFVFLPPILGLYGFNGSAKMDRYLDRITGG
jgi:hypothetical protein